MKCRNGVASAVRTATFAATVLLNGWQALAADTIEPFNGKDLSGWRLQPRRDADRGRWVVGRAKLKEGNPAEIEVVPGGTELINTTRALNIYTEAKFGDCRVELEVMVPKGANSGIYLMGNYEVQVLDSFGKKMWASRTWEGSMPEPRRKSMRRRPPAGGRSSSLTFARRSSTMMARRSPTPSWSSVRSTDRSSTRTSKSPAPPPAR